MTITYRTASCITSKISPQFNSRLEAFNRRFSNAAMLAFPTVASLTKSTSQFSLQSLSDRTAHDDAQDDEPNSTNSSSSTSLSDSEYVIVELFRSNELREDQER